MEKSKELHLDIYRHTYNTDGYKSVIGDLHLNCKFTCYTLEDEKRADGVKVYGETCIPAQTYKFIINKSTRFNRDMILLIDVPNFEGVRIHGGNSAKDTHGCPLVAYNTDDKKIWGTSEKEVTKLCKAKGGRGTITIHDSFLTYDKVNHKLK